MELSLIPNQKRLTFYIERLIYGGIITLFATGIDKAFSNW